MKRLLILGLIILCYSSSIFAKKVMYTITLKDGTSKRGFIIAKYPDDVILFEDELMHEHYYSMDHIVSLTPDDSTQIKKPKKYEQDTIPSNSFLEISFERGLNSTYTTTSYYGLSVAKCWQLSPSFKLGGGLSWELHEQEINSAAPLFVRSTYWFSNSSFIPGISADAGYFLPIFDLALAKGFYLNPSINWRFGIGADTYLHFKIGYRVESIRSDLSDLWMKMYHKPMLYLLPDISSMIDHKASSLQFVTFKVGVEF